MHGIGSVVVEWQNLGLKDAGSSPAGEEFLNFTFSLVAVYIFC